MAPRVKQPPDHKLFVVGLFKDGRCIVVVDGERKQYQAKTPQELWDDLMTIMADPALPGTVITQAQASGDDDILADACDQVEDMFGDRYGKFWGRLAGETTKRVAPLTLRLLTTCNTLGLSICGLRDGNR